MERIKLALERARQQASPRRLAAERSAVPFHPSRSPAWPEPPPPDAAVPAHLLPLDAAHLERHRIVTLQQDNPLRRSFDLLRTQVLQRMQENGWRTLAVTSPSMQSGKTVVAVNLALSIAHHPSRTALLVDFDLRRPQVATCLGLPAGDSLNEVLAGTASVEDAIVRAGLPRFLVLPTQRKVPGAAEMLASDRAAAIISALRDQQAGRIVVLDLPPVNAVDDALAVLPRVDCVLLVVGSGSSTKSEIEESRRHLARFNLLGVVANKAEEQAPGDYY